MIITIHQRMFQEQRCLEFVLDFLEEIKKLKILQMQHLLIEIKMFQQNIYEQLVI